MFNLVKKIIMRSSVKVQVMHDEFIEVRKHWGKDKKMIQTQHAKYDYYINIHLLYNLIKEIRYRMNVERNRSVFKG